MKYLKEYNNYISKYKPIESNVDESINKELLSDLFLEYADKWGLVERDDIVNNRMERLEGGSYTFYNPDSIINILPKSLYFLYIYIPETCKCALEDLSDKDRFGNTGYTLKDDFFNDMDKFLNRLSSYGLKNCEYSGFFTSLFEIKIK